MTQAMEALKKGFALHQAGRPTEAEPLYRRALEAEPGNPDAMYLLGVIAFDAERFDEAGELIGRSAEINPKNPDAHVYLGHLAKMNADMNMAETHFSRAVELAPGYALALNNLGNALRENKRIDAAIDAYERAVEADPAYVSALTNLGSLHRDEGDYEAAERYYRQALQHAPNDAVVTTYLARAVNRLGRTEEALRLYAEALRIDPGTPDANADIAIIRAAEHNHGEALAHAKTTIAADPTHTMGLALTAIMAAETGDEEMADYLLGEERFVQTHEMEVPAEFDGIGAFNESLTHHVLDHPTLRYEPPGRAIRRCSQTGSLLAEPKGPMVHLERIIHSAIAASAEALPAAPGHPFLSIKPSYWRLNVWGIVIDRPQGFVESHIHTKSWLSGVCYLELPSDVDGDDGTHAGWIEFGRAPEEFGCVGEPPITLFKPEPGKVLLFPGYFYHRTVPYQSDERRISVAFDVQAGD